MLGTGFAVAYYSARDSSRAGRYIGCAIVISMIACLPVIGSLYTAMPSLLAAQSRQIVTAARWYLLYVPLSAVLAVPLYALRGRGAFIPWNLLRIAPVVLWLLILIPASIGGIRDPRYVAWAYLVAIAPLLIPTALITKRYIPGTFLPDRREFKPLLVYGLPCFASTLPYIANLRLDQMLMAGLLSPKALGLYVVAVAWSGAFTLVMSALPAVLLPNIAARQTEEDRVRGFSRGCRLAVMLILVTTPVLAAATPWGMVFFFGKGFQAAVVPALILVPAGSIDSLNAAIKEGFAGLGRPTAILYSEVAGLVTTVVTLYLLLRPMGIVGASVASLLGYSTVTLALLLQARLLTGESPASLLLPRAAELRAGKLQLVRGWAGMSPAVISRTERQASET
jgi:O-antigen/teichoic acid export membrane protein